MKTAILSVIACVLVSSCVSKPEDAVAVQNADPVSSGIEVNDGNYDRAYEHQKARRYAQAAVLYLSLPVEYKNYALGLYNASNAYYILADTKNVKAMSTRGADDEKESLDYYEAQKARLATDFPQLQPSLFAGIVEDHWPDVMKKDVDGQYANWQKCLFFIKKYILMQTQLEWENIKDKIAENPKADFVDALVAVAGAKNERWAKKNPTGKGEPDVDMIRLGRAAYKMAFLMRRPPSSLKTDQKTAIQQTYRVQALRLLKPFWSLFGTHLEKDDAYKNGSLRFAFEALAEGEDLDGAEEAYMAYAKAYPDKKRDIKNMVATLYSLLRKNGTPEANAYIIAGSNLRSRARSLKKELFLNIGKSWPAWQKKLERAGGKGDLAVHRVLADHFWQVWIKELVFGETSTETEKTEKKKAATQKYFPDVLPELEKWWERKKSEYEKRWASNVRKEFNASTKRMNDETRDELNKAVGSNDAKIIDKLRTAVGKLSGHTQTKAQTLLSVVETNTAQDRYFAGTIFIYDLAEYLEAKALEMEERARPISGPTLWYFAEYRRLKDAPQPLTVGDLRSVAKQYFRIRDWDNTVKYLQQFADRISDERWGPIEEVFIDKEQKVAGLDRSNEEFEFRYMLGKSHLERCKISKDSDDLVQAALHLRRCHNFCLIRDANEIVRMGYKLRFQKPLEQYYLVIKTDLAEVYELLAKSGVAVPWPNYLDQYNMKLEGKSEQANPASSKEYLYAAIRVHKNVWMSFRLLEAYQYRTEFRTAYIAWLKLMVYWRSEHGLINIDGTDAMEWFKSAYESSLAEQQFESVSNDEKTKAFKAEVKRLGTLLKP
ncbi:hypothetical protein OAU50_01135 [Planctomycetota bacterium]|nr:hypothetical protein [Planctomycetota bacterium]